MKNVTIRRCPVCQDIGGLTKDVQTALKSEEDVKVNVVDGNKGEFTVEVDGRKVSQLRGDMLPSADEVTQAVRGDTRMGA
jgi:hypothetical protein